SHILGEADGRCGQRVRVDSGALVSSALLARDNGASLLPRTRATRKIGAYSAAVELDRDAYLRISVREMQQTHQRAHDARERERGGGVQAWREYADAAPDVAFRDPAQRGVADGRAIESRRLLRRRRERPQEHRARAQANGQGDGRRDGRAGVRRGGGP